MSESRSLEIALAPVPKMVPLLAIYVVARISQIVEIEGYVMYAVLLSGFYALVGGRVFCSWVCPLNVVTDTAAWLRRRLRIATGRAPRRSLRGWLAAAVLAASECLAKSD